MSPSDPKGKTVAGNGDDADDYGYDDVRDIDAYAEAADDNARIAARQARATDAKTIAELRAELTRMRALLPNALTGRLSPSKIVQFVRRGKRNMYCDGGNLYLQVNRADSPGCSWVFRWTDRVTGKIRTIGLGSYRTVNIDRAREMALHYRLQLLEHKDPRAERDDEKRAIKIAQGLVKTVSQVANEWFESKIARRAPRYRNKVFNQLRKWVHPTIGHMPIEQMDTRTILELTGLGEAWSRIHSTAKDVLMYLARIFDYASRMKYFNKANPAAWETLLDVLPPCEEVYQRKPREALAYADVGSFLQAVRSYEDRSDRRTGRTTISFIVDFVALTAVRVSEVLESQWKEIDLAHRVWNVPPEHRKNGRRKGNKIRAVPITDTMVDILAEMEKRRTDPSPDALIFPSPRTGISIKASGPANFIANTLKWEIKVTPHGFRSTLRDWMRAKTSFNEVFYKAQIDHVLGDGTKSDEAYGRDRFLEERRKMMTLWDKYCSQPQHEPPQAGKVLSMRKRPA
jgi:integrase